MIKMLYLSNKSTGPQCLALQALIIGKKTTLQFQFIYYKTYYIAFVTYKVLIDKGDTWIKKQTNNLFY